MRFEHVAFYTWSFLLLVVLILMVFDKVDKITVVIVLIWTFYYRWQMNKVKKTKGP